MHSQRSQIVKIYTELDSKATKHRQLSVSYEQKIKSRHIRLIGLLIHTRTHKTNVRKKHKTCTYTHTQISKIYTLVKTNCVQVVSAELYLLISADLHPWTKPSTDRALFGRRRCLLADGEQRISKIKAAGSRSRLIGVRAACSTADSWSSDDVTLRLLL